MINHSYWVYIVASGPCGWLYVGMTNDLIRRVGEHKHGQIDGYSRERGTDRLVWYEHHRYVDQAILREKRIKRWLRPWKFALIENGNPHWTDLYPALLAGGNPSPTSSSPTSAPATASALPRQGRCSPACVPGADGEKACPR